MIDSYFGSKVSTWSGTWRSSRMMDSYAGGCLSSTWRGHCLAENKQQWFTVRKKICKNLNIFIYSLKINYLKSISCQRSKILSSEGILFDFLNLYFSYSVISGNGDHEEEYSLRLCFPSFSSVSVFFRALIFAMIFAPIFAHGERGRYDKIAYSSS